MQEARIRNLFDLKETLARALFEEKEYPWEVLPEIGSFICAIGPSLDPAVYEQKDDYVWIAKSAVCMPTVSITGPCIIAPHAELRQCAFLRGNVIVGEGAVVGNSTEVKNSILFNAVEAPHYNYVGDSILGFHAHMGAGSITSNIKSDRTNIVIKSSEEQIETGMRKIGAILGDYCEIGCGTVLNPGTVVGAHTTIYPLQSVRGVIPAESIYKAPDQIIAKQ